MPESFQSRVSILNSRFEEKLLQTDSKEFRFMAGKPQTKNLFGKMDLPSKKPFASIETQTTDHTNLDSFKLKSEP